MMWKITTMIQFLTVKAATVKVAGDAVELTRTSTTATTSKTTKMPATTAMISLMLRSKFLQSA